ncbi:glycosyltransferase [Ectobacillus antri]|jgi:glycosyltransferase involved in cell wall biosynthesis|uniref:glycosyltransferase n=1 Tax=Ectobacillus antri TaxID=2486280 RepID=UPI000F5B5EDC|nr:glycosyltransferase [Ectobacillus antri]
MTKVSIIIPFYNCPYVAKAIESALAQTYYDIEVIVVNDGSTAFVEEVTKFEGKIKYVEKTNGGTATALNAGIRLAIGEYISWLSSDDIYEPDKISKQIQYLQQTGGSIVYSPVIFIDGDSLPTSESIGVFPANRLLFLRHLMLGCFINGCSVLVKKDILTNVGLFNENLPYTHDYDLWIRIALQYEFYYYDEPLVRYRIHENMGTKKHAPIILQETRMLQRQHRSALTRAILFEQRQMRMKAMRAKQGG